MCVLSLGDAVNAKVNGHLPTSYYEDGVRSRASLDMADGLDKVSDHYN